MAKVTWIKIDVENILLRLLLSPFPNSIFKYRLTAAVNDPVIIPNVAANDPTVIYIPYSTSPNVLNTIRVEKKDTAIISNMRKYKSMVLIAKRLFLDAIDMYIVISIYLLVQGIIIDGYQY